MRPAPTSAACFDAYRQLFANDPTTDFLARLTPARLKQTYRQRAMQLHPDRAATLGLAEYELTQRFQRISAAYEVLCRAIEAPHRVAGQPVQPPPRPNGSSTPRAAGTSRPV